MYSLPPAASRTSLLGEASGPRSHCARRGGSHASLAAVNGVPLVAVGGTLKSGILGRGGAAASPAPLEGGARSGAPKAAPSQRLRLVLDAPPLSSGGRSQSSVKEAGLSGRGRGADGGVSRGVGNFSLSPRVGQVALGTPDTRKPADTSRVGPLVPAPAPPALRGAADAVTSTLSSSSTSSNSASFRDISSSPLATLLLM
mmetsp:Transcript_10285/g.31955  ORF Transcript_10285/g.31955 Transcript_10285/m.31955 type:complete len:200 (+) Transcript_10285:1355-1954(+)